MKIQNSNSLSADSPALLQKEIAIGALDVIIPAKNIAITNNIASVSYLNKSNDRKLKIYIDRRTKTNSFKKFGKTILTVEGRFAVIDDSN